MTREEAINLLMSANVWNDEERKAWGTLVPELAESEDERAQKRAIAILKQQRDYWSYDGPVNKFPPATKRKDLVSAIDVALSCLEKQKEQNDTPLMNGDADLYFDNWIQHNDTTKRGCFEEGIRYAQRLQKEQKPAEWSEEDEKTIDDAFCWLCEYAGSLIQRNYGKSSMLYGIANKLKSLRPQSKQEWDANDKAIVNCIVCCLDGQFVPEAARKQSLEWFNKHRRDFLNIHSWKPTEDEERLINTSISFLKDFADKGYENAVECIDWLKSKLNGKSTDAK